MSFNNVISSVVNKYIFPNLISYQQDAVTNCINNIITFISEQVDLPNLYEQLSIESYKDIYMIVNMIIPYIPLTDKQKLTNLNELTDMLKIGISDTYIYNEKILYLTTEKIISLLKEHDIIHKLYINWIDILPDLEKNDGFHSILKLVPDAWEKQKDNSNSLNNIVEQNIKNKRKDFDDAVYYFTSNFSVKNKYKNQYRINSKLPLLLDEFSNIDNHKYQNWFNSYMFYWISQLHFITYFLSNRVVLLTAGTGVGKSTHMPKMVFYTLMAFEDIENPKILITIPRQKPVQENAEFISKHMGVSIQTYNEVDLNVRLKELELIDKQTKTKTEMVGGSIGSTEETKTIKHPELFYIQYQHGDRQHIPPNKKIQISRYIKFVTDKILLNTLMDNRALLTPIENEEDEKKTHKQRSLYDVVIVDEAHEHNVNIDLILSLAKQTLQLNTHIRFMIVSATLEDDEPRYRQFYKNFIHSTNKERLIDMRIHIENPLLANPYKITESFEKYPIENYVESGKSKIHEILKNTDSGDILFFLTGQGDINRVCEELNLETANNVIAIPLYTALENERQEFATSSRYLPELITITKESAILPLKQQVTQAPGKYKRKIILSTSIAEASVTIPNLAHVIDIGFSKKNKYNVETKLESLEIEPLSYSSHRQRKGRAGRVADGFAYFLYTKEDIIDSKIIPDILNINLSQLVFDLLNDGTEVQQQIIKTNQTGGSKKDKKNKKDKKDKKDKKKKYKDDDDSSESSESSDDEDSENSEDVLEEIDITLTKEKLMDITGEFYIIHPEQTRETERDFEGLFKIPLTYETSIKIQDAFEQLKTLRLLNSQEQFTSLSKFIKKYPLTLTLNEYILLINSCLSNYEKYIIRIQSFITRFQFSSFFTNVSLGLKIFRYKNSDHFTILNIFDKYLKQFPNLYINKYSIKSYMLFMNLNKEYSVYLTSYQLQNRYDAELYKPLKARQIIAKDKLTITNWCNSNFIDVDMFLNYLEAHSLYYLQTFLLKELINNYNLTINNPTVNNPIVNNPIVNNQEPLSYPNISGTNHHKNILQLLYSSYFTHIGYLHRKTLQYYTKYNVPLTLPATSGYFPNSVFNSKPNKIFISTIKGLDNGTNGIASFITGI